MKAKCVDCYFWSEKFNQCTTKKCEYKKNNWYESMQRALKYQKGLQNEK